MADDTTRTDTEPPPARDDGPQGVSEAEMAKLAARGSKKPRGPSAET